VLLVGLVHDFRSPAFVWNAGLFAFCAAVDRDIKRRLLRCGSTSATERPNSNVEKLLPFFLSTDFPSIWIYGLAAECLLTFRCEEDPVKTVGHRKSSLKKTTTTEQGMAPDP
jgi:hypothetical protein